MKFYVYTMLTLFAAGVISGCSDVGFDSVPKLSCNDVSRDQDTDCQTNPDTITVSVTFGVGDVDILFVDDNSGSMFTEQAKMANAFSSFLGRISNLFYQIAVTTTDISASPGNSAARAANGYGKFQDGRFIEFTHDDTAKTPSGTDILTRSMFDNDPTGTQSLFRGTIKRDESKACDASGYNEASCPGGDERGIYAANMAIQRGNSTFFRPGAHLAVVIVSDEDERSNGSRSTNSLKLEENDLPETLVKNLRTYYPTKSMSVHSIVTRDSTCLAQQTQTSNGRTTRGVIGDQYIGLSNPSTFLMGLGNILPGSTASICDSDYSASLRNIGDYIGSDTLNSPKQLACGNFENMTIVTSPTGAENQISWTVDAQNRISFYNLPLGYKVTFSYDCSRF